MDRDALLLMVQKKWELRCHNLICQCNSWEDNTIWALIHITKVLHRCLWTKLQWWVVMDKLHNSKIQQFMVHNPDLECKFQLWCQVWCHRLKDLTKVHSESDFHLMKDNNQFGTFTKSIWIKMSLNKFHRQYNQLIMEKPKMVYLFYLDFKVIKRLPLWMLHKAVLNNNSNNLHLLFNNEESEERNEW
jgi:hypothetical protein